MTFDLWLSPEQLSTLTACSSSEAGVTGALPTDLRTEKHGDSETHIDLSSVERLGLFSHLIARSLVRVFGVAAASPAAAAPRQVPGVGCAAVAVLANDVGEAETLSTAAVTVTVARCGAAGCVRAKLVADTLCGTRR